MDLASALTTEGVLEKQSPTLIKVFQTRYFAIRGKGDYLVWFKKKPVNPDQNPQGIINIADITEINEDEKNQKLFSIVYLKRAFNLRAESISIKQRWMSCLKTIMAHHQKVNNANKKGKEKEKKQDGKSSPETWKWKNNSNQEISEKIRLENEQVMLQDQSQIIKKNEFMLNHISKERSLTQLEKCITYGFFTKKKILSNSVRWYFLASSVNLRDQKDEELYPLMQEILQSNSPKVEDVPKKEKKKSNDSSSDEEQEQKESKKIQSKKDKIFAINTLYEFDPQTKEIKHTYNLIDFISFEIKTSQQPFEIKIVYEEVANEEQQEIKESEICLISEYLIEVKKFNQAFKIVNEKFNLQKQREDKNANKSKRFPAKKWKHVNQEEWRIPDEKGAYYVLLNRRMMRLNMLTINLEQIASYGKQSVLIAPVSQDKDKQKQKEKSKKEDVLLVEFKKEGLEFKIYIIFDKIETMTKFLKRLGKNLKKMQEALKAQQKAQQSSQKKEEEKKNNQQTYLIDKKIRETQSSIKINFYQLMDREVIAQKKQQVPKEQGFFSKIMKMFCAGPVD